MNLRHLSVFHGVAKAGSVNAAARLLHTSQPAVSRELRTLEQRRAGNAGHRAGIDPAPPGFSNNKGECTREIP